MIPLFQNYLSSFEISQSYMLEINLVINKAFALLNPRIRMTFLILTESTISSVDVVHVKMTLF